MAKQSKTRSLYFSERIIKAMNGIFDYPLTIVEAPMGYGKTTAVREHLNNARANILWQKVYDSSIMSFWNGLCSLFGKMDSNLSHRLAQLGFPPDRASMQEALKLIEEMQLSEKTVFFIDDYHLLNETEAGRFLEVLAVHDIHNLHFVLTTRFIDFPSMEELALKGYLLHITKETLELMPDEIAKYYHLCGVCITNSEAEKLYSATEGWISALYLLMLNYKAEGRFMTTDNIYKLVENAIYKPLSEEIKDFLLNMCIFDNFTKKQAVYIWGNEEAENFLDEITRKNAFVTYDANTQNYHIHKIFTTFLQKNLAKKDPGYQKKIYKKAGDWCAKNDEYFAAMHYFYTVGDFENLLFAVVLDKGKSFFIEHKELVIKYFEECPQEYKQHHLVALLVYAMALIRFNEMGLFQKVCEEAAILIQGSSLDPDSINCLMGELELLKSFTRYNDIMGMSEHHKKACKLMKGPSVFMNTKGSWTFGSPSVLYMFYRESGKLEQEVHEMKEAMPYYYQLTNGHGMGAEYIMEAEWHFNKGDFENAEITAHKALCQASTGLQPNMVICTLFLQVRLTLIKGDYAHALNLFKKMVEEMENNKVYTLMHTIDMCTGFVNACFGQSHKISEWLAEGNFNSSRLFFPARAFSNIIYGRVLLIKGEYLKLLGNVEHFTGIAAVFPNILAHIYTTIYIAAANDRLFRRTEAVEALKNALDMAVPDKVYMPFVENCDYIKPLLEELYLQGLYREHIKRILELYKPYHKAMEQIISEVFTENKPKLTEREAEIAKLAAEGFSNKRIGERLYISPNTVKTQLKSVFEKLGVHSRSLLKQYFDEKPEV
jgi:LuxR family transcriptional regulator, maltose regulon positive regulatory protein